MKKNPVTGNSLADAFCKTESGSLMVFEAKEIGPRVHKIKELVHSTFVEMPRTTRFYYKRFYDLMKERKRTGKSFADSPFMLFKASKPIVKGIAGRGGDEYKGALMTLQFTWSSKKTLTDTVDLVLK